ncbi:hypothetical protein [Marinobacter sp.]|uniref:hypothetical protein n=1 Tax=Marinobacter sp. TaxID=50741 RepID=UPI003BAD29E4
MSDSAKQIGIAVGSSLLTALVLAIAGYIFVVKENQIRIDSLEKLVEGQSESVEGGLKELDAALDTHIEKLNSSLERHRTSVDSLKLFVVAAHPDRDYVSLVSSRKLQSLSSVEFEVLANGLNEYKHSGLEGVMKTEYGEEFETLLIQHDLNEIDLQSYIEAVGQNPEIQ